MTLPNTTPDPDPGPRLLLIDDEESILRSLRRSLRRGTREILTAKSGAEALALLETEPDVHIVMSDYLMPGLDGVELLRRIKERWPRIQRIMLTGYADHAAIQDAINRSEVYRYVTKPWDDGQLQMTIASAWEQYRVVRENERLDRQLREHAAGLERKVDERTELLSAAKAEWELSFDAIRDPLVVVGGDRTVRRANRSWAEAAGLPIKEIREVTCHRALFGRETPCEGCGLSEVLEDGVHRAFDCSGHGRSYRASAYRLTPDARGPRALVYYRDVTDEERMTRQLVQTEKMAAVGQLAGGVAHEINNPLAGILAFAQMMLSDDGRSDDDVEQLGYIESSAQRAMRIVESLLSFSRSGNGDVARPLAVGELLEELQILSSTIVKGTDVDLQVIIEDPVPVVPARPNRIQQVLVNLVTNAVQAVGARGTVRITASAGETGLRLAVEDSGPGVPPELARHIFDPFFTTKPEGQGTGLGLAISYRLVEAHGGRLAVGTSERLGGAAFSFELPEHTGDAHE